MNTNVRAPFNYMLVIFRLLAFVYQNLDIIIMMYTGDADIMYMCEDCFYIP